MAGFTDAEVQTAINQFLFTQVQVPQLKTGARDVLSARDSVYDLLTTALLLRPDSYFYVIFLAKNRLSALVSQQIAYLNTIVDAAPNTTRPVKKIESTSELVNAQSAIFDITAGLNARTTGVRGSIGPAVDRFRASLASFINTELTKNVVVSGQVTQTGPELRALISTTWAKVVAAQPQIVALATNIADALSALDSVSLPQKSIQQIVARIQNVLDSTKTTLEGPTAIADSRESMLNLLAMRTILTKASTFTNPELVLMPLRGDSSSVIFLDSPGVQAALQGTTSGPFNYAPASFVDFSINSGASTPHIILPRHSRAEIRSRVFSPWVAPTPGDEAAFVVDLGATSTFTIGAPYVDGPTAAAALNAGLLGMSVTWDAGANQLVFQSVNNGDVSHLTLLTNSSPRIGFRDWAFPVAQVHGTDVSGVAVDGSEVVAAIASVTPLLDVKGLTTSLASFQGIRTAVGGEEAVLWDRRDAGADLVSTGTAVVTSPSKNFADLGIKAGMAIHTTAPSVVNLTILSVDGNVLTLSGNAPVGTLTYYIGPDYTSIPVGTRVRVAGGSVRNNAGLYRVASAGVARVTVDRNLQGADTFSVSVFTQFLRVEARGTATTSGVGAPTPSAGTTALGLATGAEHRASLTLIQLQGAGDFLLRGVKFGDIVELTSPSLIDTSVEVVSATTDEIVIGTPLPYEAGAWTYAIRSARADAYVSLQTDTNTFLATSSNFAQLDTLIGRLIRGAKYTGDITAGLTSYFTDLETLLVGLSTYAVPQESTIDNIVQTMREQGFDRALDLFLTLDVGTLFSMDPDGVSYSTWFVRQAATVAREVVPVSKFARSSQVVQEMRPVSFQPDPYDPRSEDGEP